MVEVILLMSDEYCLDYVWRVNKWRNVNINFIIDNLDIMVFRKGMNKPRAIRIVEDN